MSAVSSVCDSCHLCANTTCNWSFTHKLKKHFINGKRHTEIYILPFIHSCGFKCLKSLALAAVQQLVSPACKSELHRRGLCSLWKVKLKLFQAVQSEIEVAVILVTIFLYLIIKTFENSSLQGWTAQTQLWPLIVNKTYEFHFLFYISICFEKGPVCKSEQHTSSLVLLKVYLIISFSLSFKLLGFNNCVWIQLAWNSLWQMFMSGPRRPLQPGTASAAAGSQHDCTLFTAHCTWSTLHCTVYTVHCTLFIVHCTATVHIIACIVIAHPCALQYAMGQDHDNSVSAADTLKTVYCILWTAHLILCPAHKPDWDWDGLCSSLAQVWPCSRPQTHCTLDFTRCFTRCTLCSTHYTLQFTHSVSYTAQPLYCRVLKNLIRISLKCMLFRHVPYLFIFSSSKFKCYLHGLDCRNHFSYSNLKSSDFVHLKRWCSGKLYFGSAFCSFSSFPRISWTQARGDLQCFKSYIYLLIKIQHRKFELLAFRRTRNFWAGVTYNFTPNFWLMLKFWSALKI